MKSKVDSHISSATKVNCSVDACEHIDRRRKRISGLETELMVCNAILMKEFNLPGITRRELSLSSLDDEKRLM